MCSDSVLYLGPCFGGWYGFSSCHTPFMPVEWVAGFLSWVSSLAKTTKSFVSGKLTNLCCYVCLEENSDCLLICYKWQWGLLYLLRWQRCCTTFSKAWGTLLLLCWGLQIHSLTQALVWADRNQTPTYSLRNTLWNAGVLSHLALPVTHLPGEFGPPGSNLGSSMCFEIPSLTFKGTTPYSSLSFLDVVGEEKNEQTLPAGLSQAHA